jgi:MYXO-CTERM domain-containing protein
MAMKNIVGVVLGAVLLAGLGARRAEACGGFFCDRLPPDGTLPIAQAAENVLFVMDHDPTTGAATVEAHIQIFYMGPASEFSWVVPVTSVPTVSVGADILFDRLEPPTRPSFNVSYQLEGNCKGVSGVGAGCGSSASGGADSAGIGGGAPDGGVGPGVQVLSSGSTGPYDYVVIQSQDGATLRTWLTTNGYYVSDQSAAIVDEYVAGQYSFVALKLHNGQDTSAIRPIVLRLTATEACLPLKLTAIAATPDLRINVWVLADARAVPINYAEIAINQAKLDWFGGGRNYDQLLKDAANEAQGNAFAVEYAMPAQNSSAWFTISGTRSGLEAATTPPAFLAVLSQIGLQPTGAVLQLLRKYIPLPATLAAMGVTETSFYNYLTQYWTTNMAAFAPFDSTAAAADFDAQVLTPMGQYRELFTRPGRLTRLATFISPEEMTSDPLFIANASLPDVAPQHLAVAHVLCGDGGQACFSPVRLQTEDGQSVNYAATSCMQYARGDLDQLPAAQMAWQRDGDGDGQVVLDNSSQIMTALATHNAKVHLPSGSSGCSCATAGSPGLMTVAMAALGLGLLRRRRRR